MKSIVAYTVQYRERKSDLASSTYRFDVAEYGAMTDHADYLIASHAASQRAWDFMRTVDEAGGSAGFPATVFAR